MVEAEERQKLILASEWQEKYPKLHTTIILRILDKNADPSVVEAKIQGVVADIQARALYLRSEKAVDYFAKPKALHGCEDQIREILSSEATKLECGMNLIYTPDMRDTNINNQFILLVQSRKQPTPHQQDAIDLHERLYENLPEKLAYVVILIEKILKNPFIQVSTVASVALHTYLQLIIDYGSASSIRDVPNFQHLTDGMSAILILWLASFPYKKMSAIMERRAHIKMKTDIPTRDRE